MAYYKKGMNKPLNFKSNNSSESNSEHFNEQKIFIEQLPQGRSINTVPAAVDIDSTVRSSDSNSIVDRHTQVLRQTDSSHQSVLGAPAPGIKVGSVTRRNKMKRFRKRLRGMPKRMKVLCLKMCCLLGRKWTSAEISSPEDSGLIPPSPDQIHPKTSKDPPDFEIYQVLITNRSISRKKFLKKMDEDFIIKRTDSEIFYKDYSNKNKSLKYLKDKFDNKNKNKYINLKEEQNELFNRFLNDLDEDAKEALESKKQLAFIRFRKKDGSFDMDKKVYKNSDLPEEEHTEDKISEQLLEIYNEDDCCYSEIYIFSINSPCLARCKHVPCMIQAYVIAKLLYKKHGIKTTIGYLKPWGFIGSYEKPLSDIKKRNNKYPKESQTLGSKDIINKSPQISTEIDKELISAIYKQIIPEIENQTFSMIDTKRTKTKIPKPKLDLKQFFSKISKTENRKNFINVFRDIVSHLFQTTNSDKTFGDFREHGSERFEEYMKKIHKLLTESNHEHIFEEICEYLKTKFFPWWDEKVEDAFSHLKINKTSWLLQESAICHFRREITETEPFFEIGCVIHHK